MCSKRRCWGCWILPFGCLWLHERVHTPWFWSILLFLYTEKQGCSFLRIFQLNAKDKNAQKSCGEVFSWALYFLITLSGWLAENLIALNIKVIVLPRFRTGQGIEGKMPHKCGTLPCPAPVKRKEMGFIKLGKFCDKGFYWRQDDDFIVTPTFCYSSRPLCSRYYAWKWLLHPACLPAT